MCEGVGAGPVQRGHSDIIYIFLFKKMPGLKTLGS